MPRSPPAPPGSSTGMRSRKSRTGVGRRSARPSTCQPARECSRWKRSSAGISCTHGAHQVAQKLITSGLPRKLGHRPARRRRGGRSAATTARLPSSATRRCAGSRRQRATAQPPPPAGACRAAPAATPAISGAARVSRRSASQQPPQGGRSPRRVRPRASGFERAAQVVAVAHVQVQRHRLAQLRAHGAGRCVSTRIGLGSAVRRRSGRAG